jgi:hypothetical protein
MRGLSILLPLILIFILLFSMVYSTSSGGQICYSIPLISPDVAHDDG